MKKFRYLANVSTLKLNQEQCIGCGQCALVCPHAVFLLAEGKAQIVDLDGCIECGACAGNCPVSAIMVTPGVGCASYIIQVWLKGKEKATCGPGCC